MKLNNEMIILNSESSSLISVGAGDIYVSILYYTTCNITAGTNVG